MSKRDAEFAEFYSVAWPRVYRTTYAVAGRHALTRDVVQAAFVSAYVDWGRVSEAGEPEAEVVRIAIHDYLKLFRKSSGPDPESPAEFGPLTPHGSLTFASAEERARVDDHWRELQALNPEERAAIALQAADIPSEHVGDPANEPTRARLASFLVSNLDDVLIPGGDQDEVISQGSSRTLRRRLIAGGVAVALVALIAVPVALFAPREKAASAKNVGVWREVAASPLSPRWSSVASWTGTEAVFIGGYTSETCTARIICRGVRDGAAYNPTTDTWRTIAPAPFDIAQIGTVQIGDQTFMQGDEGWWYYDASGDKWVQIPNPPGIKNVASMAGMHGSLYVLGPGANSPIQAYDVVSNKWSSLPTNTLRPRLVRRSLVGTGNGLYVLGADPTNMPANPAQSSEFQAEFVSGSTWARLKPSGQRTFYRCCWIWTGERLVYLGRLLVVGDKSGDEGVRFAAGMTLDTTTSDWGFLPEGPPDIQDTDTWRLFAWNDADHPSPLVAFNGYVYDDRDTSWVRLKRPIQAPEAPTASVWGDGRLIAFGGANFGAGEDETTGTTNRTWVYTPRTP